MTVADWAALIITVGWALTAFFVVHVITRRPSDSKRPRVDTDERRRRESAPGNDQQTS